MKKWFSRTVFLIYMVVVTPQVAAEDKYLMDGNMLYDRLSNASQAGKNHGLGYIAGIIDLAKFQKIEYLQCIPSGVRNDQMGDIVKNFIKDYPKYRHEIGVISVVMALETAFPCKQ
ncbi:Rap1a/Tai family immunity protein [uncultured Amphritea sp.]|uniref:Rap1a/Tai family immunity protein n=1 Tax=uncultured Amphritea sp. TaxID=981605 RepID=UPI0026166869|nr:Rap1a/Tai family immunity protein [uncultured Amphritea sp.]